MEKGKRNLNVIVWVIWIILIILTLRLGYIQLLGHEELSQATRMQSMISLKGGDMRGRILDRNGNPVVGGNLQYVYIIRKNMMNAGAEKYLKQLGAKEIDSQNSGYMVYTSDKYDKNAGMKLADVCDAYILQAATRYDDNQLAEHYIGYVNKKDSSGASGLELMFDDVLMAPKRQIYAPADVTGKLIKSRNLEITSNAEKDSFVKDSITIALDSEIQRKIESIIKQSGYSMGVAVLDKQGGIIAMASSPGYDPSNIEQYVAGGNDELINKVTQGEYPPGSVFKIIIAAAALEKGVSADTEFNCKGTVDAGNLNIKCDTGGDYGHGKLNMKEAFAKSCNSYFVELAKQTGADNIIKTAENFGLGQNVLKGFPHESCGHLMTEGERQGAAIGNLGIGQGELLTTPLQIAAMTSIIAAEGEDRGVHILVNEKEEASSIISAHTAAQIRQMMKMVIESGTCESLDIEDAAAKTGTAEYMTENGIRNHAWITGFMPYDSPEYTITVFVENGESGAQTAGPVFKEIVEYLQKSGYCSRPTLA